MSIEKTTVSALKPIGSKLVVKLVEKEKTTVSGIILTRADSSEVNRGVVLAIGGAVLDVAIGDQVLPNWNNAQKTKVDGEDLFIIDESDIVLIFEG